MRRVRAVCLPASEGGGPRVRIRLAPAGSPLRTWRRRHGLREQRPQGTCSLKHLGGEMACAGGRLGVESTPWAARLGPTRLRRNWSPQSEFGPRVERRHWAKDRGNQSTAHHGQSRVCQTTAGIGLASVTEASAASLALSLRNAFARRPIFLGRFCNDALPVTVRARSFMKS